MKYDIFISYSRYDTAIVDEFVSALEDECFSVWIDRDGIESGDAFKRMILSAIKESQVVLFFSSKHSNQSEWTAKEIGVAVKYKKHIIPIKLDNSSFNEDVEFDLINLDFVDYSVAATRAGMKERLFKTLRNKLGKGKTESKAQEEAKYTGAVNDKTERRELLACPEGALPGVFSVSPTKKVFFSKGNLQYQASTKQWRFAEKQYDFIGKDNEKISPNYNGWIDSFGWGTGDDPTKSTSLSFLYHKFVSWSVNKIANGGNNDWSLLTVGGWEYLLEKRQTPSGLLYAKARVLSKTGLVLLPDNWSVNNYSFANPNCKNADFEDNIFDANQWEQFEAAGAVFLPTAGMRTGHSMFGMRGIGCYWAMDDYGRDKVNSVFFTAGHVNLNDTTASRSSGLSVRLVSYAD